jgi:hypothetical protein
MGALLPDETIDSIVSLCRTAVGDNLRSVTYFTRDDFDQLYLRDDLDRDADLMSFIGHEWHDFRTTQDVYTDSELGAYTYTIRAFENGYLIRVTTDHDGVFITADGVATDRLEEVTTALEEILELDRRLGGVGDERPSDGHPDQSPPVLLRGIDHDAAVHAGG